jgi:peptidoglycan/xylan/chitin deacetylase (PgdA/CDA1 family)
MRFLSAPLSRVRAARWTIALLAAVLASAAFVALAMATGGEGASQLEPNALIGAPFALVAPINGDSPVASLYRIIGCRSHGTLAYSHGPSRHVVAIGFDDGPYPDTPAFVQMLARNDAQATFFLIGKQVNARYRSTLLTELRNGDAIGDHTFTHPDLTRSANVRGQLQKTIDVIRSLSGYRPCVFRPPYGDYNSSVLHTARSLGLATVTWNVDPSDYLQPGTGAIERRVLSQVRPGSIIISHDGGGPRRQTLTAYPKIISALRKRGYGIVTIPQLLGFKAVYVPCIELCDGIGIPLRALPKNAIIERAQ